MNLQDHCCVRTDGSRVIIDRRFVGGADLVQLRARRFDDLTDPESATDLH